MLSILFLQESVPDIARLRSKFTFLWQIKDKEKQAVWIF